MCNSLYATVRYMQLNICSYLEVKYSTQSNSNMYYCIRMEENTSELIIFYLLASLQ